MSSQPGGYLRGAEGGADSTDLALYEESGGLLVLVQIHDLQAAVDL